MVNGLPPADINTLQIQTIRTAYKELGTRVRQVIQTQLGDLTQISQQQSSVRNFMESVIQVCLYGQFLHLEIYKV